MSFQLDLTTLYYIASKKRLHPDFLNRLVHTLTRSFNEITSPITPKNYELFLDACVTGLVEFTKLIDSVCLEAPPPTTLFTTSHKLSDFIVDYPNGDVLNPTFKPNQYYAYRALAEPLRNLSLTYKYYIHPLYISEVSDPGDCPFNYSDADKSTQRDWDRKVKEWHTSD